MYHFDPDECRVFEVEGVGGVCDRLRIVLRRGVNLLVGQNAAGKTSAIRALARAAGGSEVLDLNDHCEVGSVVGPGVVLRIGAKTTSTGDPVAELADYGLLAELIEPRGASQETRRKNQLRVLLSFVDREVDDKLLLRLADGDEEVAAGIRLRGRGGSVLGDVAREVKRMAEAVAREYEGREEAAQVQVRAAALAASDLMSELAGFPRPAESSLRLYAQRETLTEELAVMRRDSAVMAARLEERRRIGELGPRPDVDHARADLAQARDNLARQEERLKSMREAVTQCSQALRAREVQLGIWKDRKAILEKPVDGPSAQEVAAMEELLRTVRADEEAAKLYAQLDKFASDREGALGNLERLRERTVRFREIALGVASKLTEILREESFGPLQVDQDEGLSVVRADGVIEPFDRLSLGQRVSLVLLNVGIRRYPGRIMPLDPGFWSSLQPRRQRELARAAAAAGIDLISEIPVDDVCGVKSVHLGPDWIGGQETSEQYVARVLAQEEKG